jgi:hypothetical protein
MRQSTADLGSLPSLLKSGTEHQDYRIPRQGEQSAVRVVELVLVVPSAREARRW